jgi:dienelactone hydrolase
MRVRCLIPFVFAAGCAAAGVPAEAGLGSDPDAKADGWFGFSSPGCEFPGARIADTEATAAHAAAPARCGQSRYAWRTDGRVGELISTGAQDHSSGLSLRFLNWYAEIPLHRSIRHSVGSTEIEYTTQARGEIVTATALVTFPTNISVREGPLDVVLFLHGTTGFTDGCGASDDEGYVHFARLIAAFGYVVVMPDYIGLKQFGEPSTMVHPYLVGEATAMAALDAVRAAAALPRHQRGLTCMAPRVLVFGASQGGHAALWVDRLAPYYARELQLLGTVAAVPPADLYGQARRALTELVPASFNIAAMLATSAEWYDAGDLMSDVFAAPYDGTIPAEVRRSCDPDGLAVPTSVSELFAAPLVAAMADGVEGTGEPWSCILRENGIVTTSVERIDGAYAEQYEILFVLGERDSLVYTPIERSAFGQLCDRELPMRYLECLGAEHTEGTLWALPEILQFLDDKADGKMESVGAASCVVGPTECRGTPG